MGILGSFFVLARICDGFCRPRSLATDGCDWEDLRLCVGDARPELSFEERLVENGLPLSVGIVVFSKLDGIRGDGPA